MTLDITVTLIAIFALLIFAAFFAGAETALTAVSKARMYHLASEGSARAKQVLSLIANRERLIGALLLGNTFVNILASSLATSIALSLFDEGAVVIAALVMTAIILIFGEVLPKTLAIARTDHTALAVAYPVRLFVALLSPVLSTVQFIVWRILKLFGLKQTPGEPVLTAQEEIRGAIDLHHQEGGVERNTAIAGGILDLADLHVADIMVHRKNMEVPDAVRRPKTMSRGVLSSPTRVFRSGDDPENIVGFSTPKILQAHEASGQLQDIDICRWSRSLGSCPTPRI
jgi:Mg2+/Co2+ transporter CorB